MSLLDGAGIAILVLILLALSYVRSTGTVFWSDEIMGLITLHQPNWHELLRFWRDGIDSSGIFFYVFGRPWIARFGTSEHALRMYSATGIAASAAVIWIAARRYYSLLTVAACTTFLYSVSQSVRWQLDNGRTYGVLLFACSLVIYLLFRGQDEELDRPGPLFLLATFAAYALVMGSHILGALYAGFFLCVQIAIDLYYRRRRLSLYVAAAASGIVFLFSLPNIRSTMALGKPSFWTLPPAWSWLPRLKVVFDHRTVGGIMLLLLFLLLSLRPHIFPRLRNGRAPVYILLGGFLLLDLFFFGYSRFGTSIYVDRYMMPFCFAAVLLLCELMTMLQEMPSLPAALRPAAPVLFLLFALAGFFVPRLQRPWLPLGDPVPTFLAIMPPSLPIVSVDAGLFTELHFYGELPPQRRLLYPIDWPVALDRENSGGVSGPHEMDNFKAKGLYAADIVPAAEILNRYPSFVVLSTDPDLWLRRRILPDSHRSVRLLGQYQPPVGAPIKIWQVASHP